ncbi:MAG: hypothetical protein ACYC39_08335 [Thiobacillus sp.]
MQTIAHLLRLIFSPERFIAIVTELIVAEESVENPSWLQPEFQIRRRAEIQENVREQTNRFRRGFGTGILTTALTIAVGAITGTALFYLFGEPAKSLVYFIQASGAAVILGATLAEVGGDIVTYGKRSIPEQLNKLIFRGLYVAGTFLFVLSVAWDAT